MSTEGIMRGIVNVRHLFNSFLVSEKLNSVETFPHFAILPQLIKPQPLELNFLARINYIIESDHCIQ